MKKIITFIVSFVLLISIITVISLITAKKTILNKDFVIKQMEKNNYYEEVQKNIQSGFEGYIQQSGLEEDVITELYTLEEVKDDIGIMLENIYGNEKKDIDIEKVKTRLNDKIYASLANVSLTSTEKKSIESFINIIGNIYKDEISYTKWLNGLNGKVYNINEKIEKVGIYVYVLPLVLIIILIILNIKELYRALNATGIAIIGSGILTIALKFFIKVNIDIENILILNESFSNVIKSSVYEILNALTIASITIGAIGIVICYIANYIKLKKKELI